MSMTSESVLVCVMGHLCLLLYSRGTGPGPSVPPASHDLYRGQQRRSAPPRDYQKTGGLL